LLTLDLNSDKDYREWFFAFCQNNDNLPWYQRWWMRRDPVGLQHTYAFTQVGDYLLFVEPNNSHIEFTVKYPTEDCATLSAVACALELTDAGHTVVSHVYIPNIKGSKSIFNFIPSCVTVVKCATGYSSYAVSPKKLLHSLLKDGAYLYLKAEK